MSKKKMNVILAVSIPISYFLSGALFVAIFSSWSVRTILAGLTSMGVYFLLRLLLKRRFPSTYEDFTIDEKDERNLMILYQATYYGFFIGLVILMIIGSLLYDTGYQQLQNGIMISMSILLITQVFGYIFVHYKNRTQR